MKTTTRFLHRHAVFFSVLLLVCAPYLFPWVLLNEQTRMPLLKQFFDPSWLPNDWYLNLRFQYRPLFSWIFSPLTGVTTLETAALIGRFVIHLFFAAAVERLAHQLHLRARFVIPAVALYLHWPSIGANEGFLGGFEAKPAAYTAVLFALSFGMEGRLLPAMLLSGLAVSLHPQAGLYAAVGLFAAFVPMLMAISWRRRISAVLAGVIAALPSLGPLIRYRVGNAAGPAAEAATAITVNFRLADHLFYRHWIPFWEFRLAGVSFLLLLTLLVRRRGPLRMLARLGLAYVAVFLVGLAAIHEGQLQIMRPFIVRAADALLPLVGALLLASWASHGLAWIRPKRLLLPRTSLHARQILDWTAAALSIGFLLQAGWRLDVSGLQRFRTRHLGAAADLPVPLADILIWIHDHTPRESRILASPFIEPFHYVAQRARLVSFKGDAYTTEDILEWYARMTACNMGLAPQASGFLAARREVESHFYALSDAQLEKLAALYGLNYYLGLDDGSRHFPVAYHNGTFTLYSLRPGVQ